MRTYRYDFRFRLMILLAMLTCSLASKSQVGARSQFLMIGDTIPNYTFEDVINYKSSSVSIQDFRGKWLILDFWATTCGSCIKSFPKMNALAKTFISNTQVIMVGSHDGSRRGPTSESNTKKLFENLKDRMQLKCTFAFDSALYYKFKVFSLPHIFIIDPFGVIRAKTYLIDSTNLSMLIQGGTPQLNYSYLSGEPRLSNGYRKELPLLTSGKQSNGGNDTSFLFRSLLTKWNFYNDVYSIYGFNGYKIQGREGRAEVFGLDVRSMLRLAFTGEASWNSSSDLYYKYNQNIIIDCMDSSLFNKRNTATGENMYCYSLCVPPNRFSVDFVKKMFQQDLQRYFGFKASVQQRLIKAWKLTVIDEDKLKKFRTEGGDYSIKYLNGKYEGFSASNITCQGLITETLLGIQPLKMLYNDPSEIPPIFDCTNVKYGLDLQFDVFINDFYEVKRKLNSFGLDLIQGDVKLNTIVVESDYR